MEKEYLSVSDICEMFGCSKTTAHKLIDEMPAYRIGGKLYVKKEDFLEWAETKKVEKVPKKPKRREMERD